MFFRSQWLPARIPFTLLMLPLFWIMLLLSPNLNEWRSLWVLFIVHALLYGAVNGYVNVYDSRKKINKPVVLGASVALHTSAIVLGFLKINLIFAVLIFAYGLAGHLFGVPGKSSKVPPAWTWVIIRTVQGTLASVLYYAGLNNFPLENIVQLKILIPGIVSSLILSAYFPGKPFPDRKAFYQSFLLLVIAAVLSVLFFSFQISAEYNTGLYIAFTLGSILLFHRSAVTSQEKLPVRSGMNLLISWIATLGLNGYVFYLLLDFTHLDQLLH